MLIISQDKKVVINFDNTLGLQVEEHISNNDGEKDFELKVITEKRSCNIGIYETEKRAKEVLQEITSAYSDFKYYAAETGKKKIEIGIKIYQNYKSIDLYEMPEE